MSRQSWIVLLVNVFTAQLGSCTGQRVHAKNKPNIEWLTTWSRRLVKLQMEQVIWHICGNNNLTDIRANTLKQYRAIVIHFLTDLRADVNNTDTYCSVVAITFISDVSATGGISDKYQRWYTEALVTPDGLMTKLDHDKLRMIYKISGVLRSH
jgi:hypothetical protein